MFIYSNTITMFNEFQFNGNIWHYRICRVADHGNSFYYTDNDRIRKR